MPIQLKRLNPLITLVSEIDKYSEEWRHECEARAVLNMPLLDGQNYLQLVEQKRGKSARDYLQVKVRELWITKYRSLNR